MPHPNDPNEYSLHRPGSFPAAGPSLLHHYRPDLINTAFISLRRVSAVSTSNMDSGTWSVTSTSNRTLEEWVVQEI